MKKPVDTMEEMFRKLNPKVKFKDVTPEKEPETYDQALKMGYIDLTIASAHSYVDPPAATTHNKDGK